MVMKITIEDIKQLIEQWENEQTEFKESFSKEVMREISTKICSFANSLGGTIIFGVSNDQELIGCNMDDIQANQISQAAKDCSPPINNIEIIRVKESDKLFPVIHIPRSTIIHSDSSRKFPIRTGTVTAYLDAVGLVNTLRERGLIGQEMARGYSAPRERKRETTIESDLKNKLRALNSNNEELRLEGLTDILIVSNDNAVLEIGELAKKIGMLLTSGTDKERDLILQMLRTIALWGSEKEKAILASWADDIITLAKSSSNAETARKAFDVILCSRNQNVDSILLHWVYAAKDDFYTELQPRNLLQMAKSTGLQQRIIDAMYSVLEKNKDKTTNDRAHEIIEASRKSYI